MKLIVGLGNPGRLYEHTRHNIGQAVIRKLGDNHTIALKRNRKLASVIGEGLIEGVSVRLALPVAYMNNSGPTVRRLIEHHEHSLRDVLIVHDDIDLELGRLQFKRSGRSAGHRGINSIIDSLRTNAFQRLRIGVGRPRDPREETADFVLSLFSRKERKVLRAVIEKASWACGMWVSQGIDACMSTYHKRSEHECI